MKILRISKNIKNKNSFKSSKLHRTLIFFVLKIKKTGKKDNYVVMFNFYFFIFNLMIFKFFTINLFLLSKCQNKVSTIVNSEYN